MTLLISLHRLRALTRRGVCFCVRRDRNVWYMLKVSSQAQSCGVRSALWACCERVASALTRWGLHAAAANLHEVTDLTVFLLEAATDLHLLTLWGCRVCECEAGPSGTLPDQIRSAGSWTGSRIVWVLCVWLCFASIKQAVCLLYERQAEGFVYFVGLKLIVLFV